MSSVVMDASALLAWIRKESGGEQVRVMLPGSAISMVNWCEVMQRLIGSGISAAGTAADLQLLGVSIHPFDRADAQQAAELWAPTRQAGLSLADRACLALAKRLALPAWTADRAWAAVDCGVDIHVIRHASPQLKSS